MFPSILIFNPKLAKTMLSYRIYLANASEYNAKLFNTSGWRYKIGLKFQTQLEIKFFYVKLSKDLFFS